MPAPLQIDLSPTNGPRNSPEAGLALRNGDIACDDGVPGSPDPSPDEDPVDVHGSESRRDPRPLASHGENFRPPDESACLDTGDATDESDKKHPFHLSRSDAAYAVALYSASSGQAARSVL